MKFNDIKEKIYKASETKAFWANVSIVLLSLAIIAFEGFEVSVFFFAAVILIFSVSRLVWDISLIFSKLKSYRSLAITTAIVVTITIVLYYYEHFYLIKFSYIFGVLFGIGIMLIYGIAALIDKVRG